MNSEHSTPSYTMHGSATWPCYGPGVSFTYGTQSQAPCGFVEQRYGVKDCMALGFATPIRPSCIRKTSSRGAFDYVLESVMTLCVEAYTGERECEAGRAADH